VIHHAEMNCLENAGKWLGIALAYYIDINNPEKIIKSITDSIELIFKRIGSNVSDVSGIGMGVTGPLDIKNGTILE